MLIKEIFIRLYGPLHDRQYKLSPGFNLLHGANETGKSLTIDALVKLLLGRRAREKEFENLRRVDEKPDGYVLLQGEDGQMIKLPEKGTLSEIAGLSPDECRNIFVVRNSNLSIADDEAGFYTDITGRLTGLRTREIAAVKEKLLDMARLTPAGQFKNIGEEKLRSRLDNARALKEKIDSLLARLQEEQYETLEQEQADRAEELRRVGSQLEALEQARRRDKYLNGRAALEQLRAAREAAAALHQFTAEDERRWSEGERDLQRLRRQREELQAELQEKETARMELARELQEKQRAFKIIDERKKTLEDSVQPELRDYDRKQEELTRRKSGAGLMKLFFAAAAAVAVVSLLGAIINPSLPFIIIAVLSITAAFASGLSLFRLANAKSTLDTSLQRMQNVLSRYGLVAGGAAAVRAALQNFAEEHALKSDELNRLQAEESALAREIETLRQKLPKIDDEMEGITREIDKIKRRSGAATLQEYLHRLKHKEEMQKQIDTQQAILQNLFEEAGPDPARWEAAVSELESYRDLAADIKHSEKAAADLQKERQACQDNIKSLRERMQSFAGELQDVERQVNAILPAGDYLPCQTTVDLLASRGRLEAFIREHEENRYNALRVIDIFNEMEAEEQDRVSELFGAASPVSAYFRDITGGLYTEVRFDRESGEIRVLRNDDTPLSAGKLSGGAYDQLYLSIRLALGEKLLLGGKGFFILDDPFIKSDTTRLQRQLQTLLAIAACGWQIIYFTAKDEVKEGLREELDNKTVNYLQIKSPGI